MKAGLKPTKKQAPVVRLTRRKSDEEHVGCDGSRCPACDSLTVEQGDTEVICEEVLVEQVCTRCGFQYHNTYRLSGYDER